MRNSVDSAPAHSTRETRSNAKRSKDHWDHDRQHDAKRVEQNLPLGQGNRPFRIEHAFRAATERRGAYQADSQQTISHVRPRGFRHSVMRMLIVGFSA
jgi:hypothetical protein